MITSFLDSSIISMMILLTADNIAIDGKDTGVSGTNWSIDTFLENLGKKLTTWGQLLLIIIGIVMIIVGVFKIAQGLMSSGRGQTNWVINILLVFFGGVLAASGGWKLVASVAAGGQQTLNDLGNASGTSGTSGTGSTIIIDASDGPFALQSIETDSLIVTFE
jgi:hypothetical protein